MGDRIGKKWQNVHNYEILNYTWQCFLDNVPAPFGQLCHLGKLSNLFFGQLLPNYWRDSNALDMEAYCTVLKRPSFRFYSLFFIRSSNTDGVSAIEEKYSSAKYLFWIEQHWRKQKLHDWVVIRSIPIANVNSPVIVEGATKCDQISIVGCQNDSVKISEACCHDRFSKEKINNCTK